jgi:DNA adenine methylase
MFFFLNKVCFNGIYRVNSSGKFNVPIGYSKTFLIPTEEKFIEASKLFKEKKISFYSKGYEEIMARAKKGDLIYLDPPYFPDETSKFVGYTDPSFKEEQHIEMLEYCYQAFEKGVNIIISNSNSSKFQKLILDKFKDYPNKLTEKSIPTKRSINPKAKNKERFTEKLYIISQKGE